MKNTIRKGNYKASAGLSRYYVEVSAHVMEDSISLEITGGEKPHVGCVVLAMPEDDSARGCDLKMLTVPEHKDHLLAGPLAEELCRKTGYTVSVSAGIHIDNAKADEIRILIDNARKALDIVIAEIKIDI